jgi:hypothetical protein
MGLYVVKSGFEFLAQRLAILLSFILNFETKQKFEYLKEVKSDRPI